MNTIDINVSKKYQVIVEQNIIDKAGLYAAQIGKYKKVAIISDSNVFPLYGTRLIDSMNASAIQALSFTFQAGEAQKNLSTYTDILAFLSENAFSRSDLLIALGGGVVGDITGFVAATYLRGVDFIQIPTTLLAMVDSSVGGKTAVDLPAGKNLVGAFYQPKLVLCDLSTLNSLPEDIFRDGCAEIIKYGVLFDQKLFEHLKTYALDFDRKAVISRCIELKRDVVQQDEFDRGVRQLLNFGHTIGHGVEKHSHYTISHGQAVAIGMAIVARACAGKGLCQHLVCKEICEILDRFQLPVNTVYSAQQLYESALSDKKRSNDLVNLIVPVAIGSCNIMPTPLADIKSFIEAGL